MFEDELFLGQQVGQIGLAALDVNKQIRLLKHMHFGSNKHVTVPEKRELMSEKHDMTVHTVKPLAII